MVLLQMPCTVISWQAWPVGLLLPGRQTSMLRSGLVLAACQLALQALNGASLHALLCGRSIALHLHTRLLALSHMPHLMLRCWWYGDVRVRTLHEAAQHLCQQDV